MEDFSLGSILASLVASFIIILLFGYTYKKKQSIKIKKTTITGDVIQKNQDSDNTTNIEQSLELDNVEISGSVSQENHEKKKSNLS